MDAIQEDMSIPKEPRPKKVKPPGKDYSLSTLERIQIVLKIKPGKDMGQVIQKCVLCHMRTTKVQISQSDQHLCCSLLR